jgi:hypothetical protein
LKLRPVVGLDDVHAKGQPPKHVVHELNGRALGARVKHFEDAHPRAVIDRGELVQPAARAWDALEELDVDLQPMAGLRFFVPLPAFAVGAMLLIRRQPRHPASRQDAVDRRAGDRHLMKSLQVGRDPAGSEVIVLPEIDDLADDVVGRRSRHATRRPRAVAQPGVPVLAEPPSPFVERFPRDPESTARPRDIARRRGMLQYLRPPGRDPKLLCLRHRVSTLGLRAVKGERNVSP